MIVFILICLLAIFVLFAYANIQQSQAIIEMGKAMQGQAQATTSANLVSLGLIVLACVVVFSAAWVVVTLLNKRPSMAAKKPTRPAIDVIDTEVREVRPQLAQGDPIQQLTQLMTIKLMADMMKEKEERQ